MAVTTVPGNTTGPAAPVDPGQIPLADGHVLIGNVSNVAADGQLVAGTNITLTPGPGTITIDASGGGGGANDQWTDTGTDYTVTGVQAVINFGGAKDMTVTIPDDGDYLISAEVCEDWSAVTAASGEATYYQLVKTAGAGAPSNQSGNLMGTGMSTLVAAIVGANVFSRSWQIICAGLTAGDEVSLEVVRIGTSTGAIKIRSAFGDAQSYMNAVKCS